ncbi:ApeP family dehydratase [Dickeya zeae]|uniref:3-hydroxy-fatty acyl-ACP dehydratase n=1 Tax=Dickeya zeae TaxID=204042 RepID=A0ABX8W4T8_9GAMM|nr:hotdog family protein [Dickeya zeae]QYM93004.1 3-hydroxy-fatty acyl-ACP dehydratase [Dickeya zeae]
MSDHQSGYHSADYYSPHHYLPHHAPMVMVDEVVRVDQNSACCRVRVSRDGALGPFLNAEGNLPAWFGIEIIAQTVGVWAGWHHRQHQDEKPRPGMLLGGRGYRSQQDAFPAGALLEVNVTLLMRDDKIGSFDGDILIAGDVFASGRANTYQPDETELQRLLEQGND